jgi:hypothetical protein
MIKTLTAAVAAIFVSGAAMAGGLSGTPADPLIVAPTPEAALSTWDFVGATQYEFEAEVFTFTTGVQYTYQDFAFVLTVTGEDTPTNSFDFSGADLMFVYSATENFDLYGGVSADGNWDHDGTTLGVAWRF